MPSLSSSAIDSLDSLLTEFTSLSSSSSTPRLPGTFLAVSSSSSPLYLKASGLRNVEDPSDPRGPVRTDTTKIPIASCTKLLAALSVLSLFDERPELGLTAETKVDQWLPELKRGTMKVLTGFKGDEPILEDIEEGKDITIGMLLSHTSGISYGFPHSYNCQMMQKYIALNKVPSPFALDPDCYLKLPLICQPGTQWNYSLGLDFAGLLVHRITSKPLDEFISERFLQPLGMSNSSFHFSDLLSSNAFNSSLSGDKRLFGETTDGMSLHWRVPSSDSADGKASLSKLRGEHPTLNTRLDQKDEMGRNPIGYPSGGAGLWSTCEDYSKLLSYVLKLGKVVHSSKTPSSSCKLLSKETASYLLLPYSTVPGAAKVLSVEDVLDPTSGFHDISHTLGQAHLGLESNVDGHVEKKHGSRSGLNPGSIFWSGITQCFYTVDPKADIAICLMTQLFPYGDSSFAELLQKATRIVYQDNDSK